MSARYNAPSSGVHVHVRSAECSLVWLARPSHVNAHRPSHSAPVAQRKGVFRGDSLHQLRVEQLLAHEDSSTTIAFQVQRGSSYGCVSSNAPAVFVMEKAMGLLKITCALFMLWYLTKTESGIACRKGPAARGTELFMGRALA